MEHITSFETKENLPVSYFSIPEEDGSFMLEKSKNTPEGLVFYKIIPKNSSTAELVFLTGDNDERALNRWESYLNKACNFSGENDYEKLEKYTAKKIELIEPGEVQLLNNKWVITKRCNCKLQ